MRLVLQLLLLLLPVLAFAQPEKKRYDHEGEVTLADGTVQKGIVRVYGNDDAPWGFQSSIRFITDEAWAKLTKAKDKYFEKYDPSDIKGYYLKDLDQTYVSKPFADLTSVSFKMISRNYFMRQLAGGKVNVYFYYDAPPNVYVGSEEDYEKLKQEKAMNNYVLVEQETDKLKNSTDIDIQQLIADCPVVLEKYLAGGYGPSPMDKGEKKKGLGKFVAKVIDSNRMKDYLVPILREYNACMQ